MLALSWHLGEVSHDGLRRPELLRTSGPGPTCPGTLLSAIPGSGRGHGLLRPSASGSAPQDGARCRSSGGDRGGQGEPDPRRVPTSLEARRGPAADSDASDVDLEVFG